MTPNIRKFPTKDFNIKTSLIKPIKGGKPIFKINKKNKLKIKIEEKEINLITIKERVFHQAINPIIQNIKGEIKP
jgi:hypothetical protein